MAFESQPSRLNVRKGESLLPFLTQQGRTPVFQQSQLLCLVVQLYRHVSCCSGLRVAHTQSLYYICAMDAQTLEKIPGLACPFLDTAIRFWCVYEEIYHIFSRWLHSLP